MNRLTPIVLCLGLIVASDGCSRKTNPVSPGLLEYDFPPDTKFAVTLYSATPSVSVGATFEVRVVLYNVSNVAGVALDISYPISNTEITGITSDTLFFPPDSVVSLSNVNADSGRVEYGVSYRNSSSGASKTGSGLVCTLKCKATAAGSASFVIDRSTLQIVTPNGTLINNFANLLVENLTISIH